MSIESELERASEAIAACGSVAVSCHVSPDGDALGSALAMTLAAQAAGKDSVVSFGEPFELPDSYGFLRLDLLVPPTEFPAQPELMIAFDTGAMYRLGSLAACAGAAKTLVVVDHHGTNQGFGHINIIDPAAGASAELCFLLLQRLGWDMDSEVATSLLTGLVTDTGRYQYSATSPQTMRIAADLIAAGARPEQVGQQMFENVPFGYLAVASIVLGRAVLEPDHRLVWSVLTKADLQEAGIAYSDAEGLIDDIRIAREAEVAVLLKEVAEGTKASLRSRSEIDVGDIAAALGGGGHPRAAGFTDTDEPAKVIEKIRELLPGG